MKRELFAALLLLALLAGGAANTRFLGSFTGKICGTLAVSEASCRAGDYERALTLADEALGIWRSREAYTGVFIRHTEIDAVTYGFRDLISALEAEPENALAMYSGLTGHVRSLYEMERVTAASVF